jgi:E3 ubiquitin-protein ligase UBR3
MLSRNTPGDFNELSVLFGHIIRYLESSPLYIPDSDFGDRDYESKLKDKKEIGYTEKELDSQIQSLLLPYLRVAALLRHQIYEQELPFISTKAEEFGFLARFLGLGGRDVNFNAIDPFASEESLLDMFKAHKFLRWISPTPLTAIWTWCEDLISFIVRARVSALYLIETQHILWDKPRLLELPQAYDVIFQYYHRRPCSVCGQVPKDPNVCLICGTLVCMRDPCCKQQSSNMYEAVQHSVDCGAGTAIYLSINLSTVVVLRGRRACLWGSVYLDTYGEEDRDLKRGRPLFLSKERYALLEQQWTSHRFDHTTRKWIWHRDTL